METTNTTQNKLQEDRYEAAYKRMKRIKSFYVHALVFVIVNLYLIFDDFTISHFEIEKFWRFKTFSTTFFWGIGLFFHGFSVFGRDFIFSNDWEQKKINEFMKKEQSNHEKWQ